MNFILWGDYTAFQKYLVFFFWTKDGEDSHGKLDLPCSLYLTCIKAKEKTSALRFTANYKELIENQGF